MLPNHTLPRSQNTAQATRTALMLSLDPSMRLPPQTKNPRERGSRKTGKFTLSLYAFQSQSCQLLVPMCLSHPGVWVVSVAIHGAKHGSRGNLEYGFGLLCHSPREWR